MLGFVLPLIKEIENRLRFLPEVKKVTVAGSVRRMMGSIGDADFLIVSDNSKRVTEYFISMPEVESVQAKSQTKSTIRLQSRMHCDLRIVSEKSFGAALQYFTGSKDHNISLEHSNSQGIEIKRVWAISGRQAPCRKN